MTAVHRERHRFDRIGWLRAAVLGANDGIVSVASLSIGVSASSASRTAVLIAGAAGLVGGAMSMAAGEYVSVSAQRDTEIADIAREARELSHSPDHELEELTDIYVQRGLEQPLAQEVAKQLTAHDPLEAHLRDELGMTGSTTARPWQAAFVSATGFTLGATPPLTAAALATSGSRIGIIAVVALGLLALIGAAGGRIGGAQARTASLRVVIGGGLAMAVTALIGTLVGNFV